MAASIAALEAAPRKGGNWWMIAVLYAYAVVAQVDRQIVGILVNDIKADLNLSDFQIGVILGPAFALPFALAALMMGWAADHLHRRKVIFSGIALWGLATLAGGGARHFLPLLLSRVGVGIGIASLTPVAHSLIADEFHRGRRTLATSIYQSAGAIGVAIALTLGGVGLAYAETLNLSDLPLVGTLRPWQMVMMMAGAPAICLTLFAFSFAEPARTGQPSCPDGDAAGREEQPLRRFLSEHRMLIILMMAGASGVTLCGFSMVSWGPAYMGRRFGWAAIEYGPALGLVNLIASASLIVNGRLVDILFQRGMKDVHLRFFSWMLCLSVPAAALLFLVSNPYLFLALYAVVLISTVPIMVHISGVIALLAPSIVRGRMIASFMFVFTILGLGIGPALVGALTDRVFGDQSMLGASLGVVMVAGLSIALLCMRSGLRYLGPAVEGAGT